jgi:iron(III) transport system ATP-binding protein
MIAVTVRKLVVRFGDTLALDGIDLRIEPGELFLLLGPSGCGKTTLLRTIAGFTAPDSGTVLFGDENVTDLAPHLRNTGMVFQSFALWPHLTVAENVAFGLRERKVPKSESDARVREALGAVRMGQHTDRPIDQLSGGEQQRVALARALVVRPRCLLLDEPLSNLDAKLRHSMREEIRRICKQFGLTAVYVTHDQKEALAIADRVAVMKAGRILQVGAPTEIYRAPASREVAAFIGETNLLEGTVAQESPDGIRVRTALGDLFSTGPARPFAREGAMVWVSLRPECFSLGTSSASNQSNALSGEIEATMYLGEIAEHRFRSGAELLRIYEINPGPKDPAIRTAVIAPGDVTLLPHEGAGP